MDGFLKEMLEKAQKEGRVHVVEIKPGESAKIVRDEETEAKEEAAHIAKMNKILYEAHICAGFTGTEALALTVAVIKAQSE